MKTINVVKIQGLRLNSTPVEVTSAVSGTKGLRYGTVVFGDMLPKSAGQKDNNVIQLSDKQLDNLCSGCGISIKGRAGWNALQGFLLRGGHAYVSSEEHKEGDVYVDTLTGEEKKYTMTRTNNSIDSIILPQAVVEKLQDSYIKKVTEWKDSVDDLSDILTITENAVKTE